MVAFGQMPPTSGLTLVSLHPRRSGAWRFQTRPDRTRSRPRIHHSL